MHIQIGRIRHTRHAREYAKVSGNARNLIAGIIGKRSRTRFLSPPPPTAVCVAHVIILRILRRRDAGSPERRIYRRQTRRPEENYNFKRCPPTAPFRSLDTTHFHASETQRQTPLRGTVEKFGAQDISLRPSYTFLS